jgi:hypothetical protein
MRIPALIADISYSVHPAVVNTKSQIRQEIFVDIPFAMVCWSWVVHHFKEQFAG